MRVDLSLERELQGVGEQIQNDLLPHVAIHEDRLGDWLAFHREAQTGVLHRRIERAGDFRREGGQVGGLIRRLHASGFHTRKIQEGIDELEQSEPVAPHRDQLFLMFGTEPLARFRQHFLKGTEHQRQRRAEFVADVAEKCRLGAIELGQGLCPLAFLLVGAGAGQSDRDLFGNPIDELAVRIVKGPAGMDSRDEETQRFAVFSEPDRHHACFFGRDWPIGYRHARSAVPEFDQNPIFRQCGVESPKVLAVAVDDRRMQSFVGFHAGACQVRLMFGSSIFIEKCEREAQAIFAEGFRTDAPNFFFGSRSCRSRRQVAKQMPASIFEHPFRRLEQPCSARRLRGRCHPEAG